MVYDGLLWFMVVYDGLLLFMVVYGFMMALSAIGGGGSGFILVDR